jgi:hypothetical protein
MLAVVHARVFDPERKRLVPDQTVVVQDDRIVEVSAKARVPQGAEVIDAHGRILLPGLWDMHAHLERGHGVLDIASGVTVARDLGGVPDIVDEFKQRFDAHVAVGPRVLRAGFIEGRGEKAAASVVTAETDDEAKRAVEFYAKRGYEQIKIYNSIKPELVPVLAAAAHAKGMRVSGHVPAFMRAEDVVRAGYDEIQHANMLLLNFLVQKDTDTRSPLRFTLVAEKAAELDLGSKAVKDFVSLLKEHRTVSDPTLNAFENLLVDRVGELGPAVKPIASRLPVPVRRFFLRGGVPVPPGKDALYKQSFDVMLRFMKKLHEAGVPLVPGTDNLPGLMFHRELELWVQAGISPVDALAAATIGSARVMHKEGALGSIAPGKGADMALVDGDPTTNISDLRRVVTVISRGAVYDAAATYAAASIKP